MNEFRRHEAYVHVDGVVFDVKIDGFARQARAVHGDVVACLVDDEGEWERLMGEEGSAVGEEDEEVDDVESGGGVMTTPRRLGEPWRICQRRVVAGCGRRASSWACFSHLKRDQRWSGSSRCGGWIPGVGRR